MERGAERVRATDFYTETVLPVLAERLDHAFPEFGWRRDARGWVATNEEHTHARLGVRAQRVVAHGPAPRGFLIHGGEPMLWTAYVSGSGVPRGMEFMRAVGEIARRAGVDPAPIERATPRNPRADLLEEFFGLCRRELGSERGGDVREYLERRGIPGEAVKSADLGLIPPVGRTRQVLGHSGYREAEIAAVGIFADSRWPGRLCGAWRNEYGRIGTLWTRAMGDVTAADTRYLYLSGASRTNLPPYGVSDLRTELGGARREVVLVEGFMDLHQLRAHGIENIVALGGTSTSPRTFERLDRLGIDVVTLCLDRDDAGRAATARAVEHSARARKSPEVYVIDPERLAPAKDPDALVRELGPDAWHRLIDKRTCGTAWRAHEFARTVSRDSPAPERRAALARAGLWLGALPSRLALEQEDAIRLIAERCGYSSEAVTRSLRARFWGAPDREGQPSSARIVDRAAER
ncbi:MAG: toprim domain-containing protein [Actinomycetota bacterium]|nr:toprim domain-containing protein [Actinomycetota bacterium]